MSWESTIEYYRIINELVNHELGGLNSSQCILYSVNFAEIEAYQRNGDWDEAGKVLSKAARSLQAAGADLILICTNTMHLLYKEIQESVHIPVVHIADSTAEAILADGISTVALLGTKFTMSKGFYKDRLRSNFGLHVLIPDQEHQDEIHRVIYEELCLGIVKDESREKIQRFIKEQQTRGARGIILGCTELGLIIRQRDNDLPIYDTTRLHAAHGVRLSLQDS